LKIPFFDLKRQHARLKGQITEAVARVMDDTAFSGGPYVDEFEKLFARFCGTSHAAGVGSGTDALHLVMRALDIGPGDEVILPANTFIATAWGVSYVGAKPVFVDCDPDTWNIDTSKIEQKLTGRTKAVIGVHLYGQPFDIDGVKAIAGKHGLKFVEDCAQAQGALYKGAKVGGFGEAGCFSFYPGKNLGAYGEAGGITTNDPALDGRVRSLRNHGSVAKYNHDELGFNMRMDGIQGAVLSVKLGYLDEWNARRRQIARMYLEGIKNPKIKTQKPQEGGESVYHLFVVTTKDREGLKKHLEANDVWPGIHYPVPCHLQKAYAGLGHKKGEFPHSEALADGCLSLPMFPELTDEEAQRVIEVINRY
jgi:dTDP-4-amino-4,6-dideoxygalactose transaminase